MPRMNLIDSTEKLRHTIRLICVVRPAKGSTFHNFMVPSPIYQKTDSFLAVVLEAIQPRLCSRQIFSEDTTHLSKDFPAVFEAAAKELGNGMLSLSPFEQDWYRSLLKDRLRRVDALHRIGVIHGDIHDLHFRLPNDIYDTVLYDFSESYTFSKKQPFQVYCGKPRSLTRISHCEREDVFFHIHDR